jgi:hypothetical protein
MLATLCIYSLAHEPLHIPSASTSTHETADCGTAGNEHDYCIMKTEIVAAAAVLLSSASCEMHQMSFQAVRKDPASVSTVSRRLH